MALVSGKVIDAQGRPVAGARVFFSRSPLPVPDVALVTGDDGSYTMSAPSEGHYEITAVADEHGSTKAEVEVRGNAEHQVELRVGTTGDQT
jgi:hypothetical protein